jgi:hypothetical protein
MTCESCVYSEKIGDAKHVLKCRRYAPMEHMGHYDWPRVMPTDWCGDGYWIDDEGYQRDWISLVSRGNCE